MNIKTEKMESDKKNRDRKEDSVVPNIMGAILNDNPEIIIKASVIKQSNDVADTSFVYSFLKGVYRLLLKKAPESYEITRESDLSDQFFWRIKSYVVDMIGFYQDIEKYCSNLLADKGFVAAVTENKNNRITLIYDFIKSEYEEIVANQSNYWSLDQESQEILDYVFHKSTCSFERLISELEGYSLNEKIGNLEDYDSELILERLFLIASDEEEHNKYKSLIESHKLSLGKTFDSFVKCEGNETAIKAAEAISVHTSPSNLLYIFGPNGVGKSHLLNSIGIDVLKYYPDVKIMITSFDKIANDLLHSLKNNGAVDWRNRYSCVDYLLIDNEMETLRERYTLQKEIIYMMKSLLDNGKYVIITGRSHPDNVPELSEDFKCFIKSGLLSKIYAYDDIVKYKILKNMAIHEYGLEDTKDVKEICDYIFDEFNRDTHELNNALKNIVGFSKLMNRKLSLKYAKRILYDYSAISDRVTQSINRNGAEVRLRLFTNELSEKEIELLEEYIKQYPPQSDLFRFWKSIVTHPDYRFEMTSPGDYSTSSSIANKIKKILTYLGSKLANLSAEAYVEFYPSHLDERVILDDHGGFFEITLEKGKVDFEDVFIE